MQHARVVPLAREVCFGRLHLHHEELAGSFALMYTVLIAGLLTNICRELENKNDIKNSSVWIPSVY